MNFLKAVGVASMLFLCVAIAHAKSKKPDKLPAAIDAAQYVCIEAVDGQASDLRLAPEDREAIANVYDAFADWNRYVLVTSPDQADLIIVVRKGRLAEGSAGASGNAGIRIPPEKRGGSGIGMGGEVGSDDDLFEVYQRISNAHRTLLWLRKRQDGLVGPTVPLFQEFKAAVERDYPAKQHTP